MKPKLNIGNLSDIGKVRKVNEDYFGSFSGKYGHLIVVCDGMGGHKGGETASRLSVETIRAHFDNLGEIIDPGAELEKALIAANTALIEKSQSDEELREMGATVVALLIKDDKAHYAHIGDSRIYLVRNEKIYQLTKDHSLVQQMIDAKIITAETARVHPKRNIISRSLGPDGNSDPEVASEPLTLFKKDKFVLCSDGLTGYVSDEELLEVVSDMEPQNAAKKLINMANQRGGKDNITVQIVKVLNGKRLPAKLNNKLVNLMLMSSAGLFLVMLVTALYSFGIIGNGESTNKSINKAGVIKSHSTKTKDTINGTAPANNKTRSRKKSETDKSRKNN